MMANKKRKPTPDLSFDVDHVTEFSDTPKGQSSRFSTPGVMTSFSPTVAALNEGFQRKAASRKKAKPAANGNTEQRTGKLGSTDRRRLKDLDLYLNSCLDLAQEIETKRAANITQLLSDARTQIQQLLGK